MDSKSSVSVPVSPAEDRVDRARTTCRRALGAMRRGRGARGALGGARGALGAALVAAALALPLGGCGGGDTSDETAADGNGGASQKSKSASRSRERAERGSADGSIASTRAAALELLDAVKASGLDISHPDEFAKAYDYLRSAKKLVDDGEVSKARAAYARATNTFRDMQATASESAGEVAEAADARQSAEAARAKADAANAKENAPREYGDAVKRYDAGVAALRARSGDATADAVRAFEDAAAFFDDAVEMAEEGQRNRLLAQGFQGSMVSVKERAEKQGADTKALAIWQQASNSELMASTSLQTGDFRGAAQHFRQAGDLYTRALQTVMDDTAFRAEMELAKAEAEKRRAEYDKQRQAEVALGSGGRGLPPPPDVPPETGGPVVVNPTPSGFGGPDTGSAGFGGPVAACVREIASKFPQELDDEDEAFLIENIHHLSRAARYDPDTGGIEFDYSNGDLLKADINLGRTPAKHAQFRDPSLATIGGEVSEAAWISMMGNTSGFVTIPIPFIYKVRMTWVFQIETMTGKGHFGAFVSFDPKKGRLRTNFADIGLFQSGKPPNWRRGKKPGSNANDWHTKLREVNWVVDFESESPDGESTLETIFDHAGEEEFNNQVSGKLSQRGFIGFEWAETRFKIKRLQACGFLDKKAAVETLRAKLKQPKVGGPAVAGGSDDDDDDDDNPAAPEDPDAGADGSGDDGEKGDGEEGAGEEGDDEKGDDPTPKPAGGAPKPAGGGDDDFDF